MSAKNEVRQKVAYVLLAIGGLLLLLSGIMHSAGGHLMAFVGSIICVMGGVMLTSVWIIDGVPWLTRLIARIAEPSWNGEAIFTDAGEHRIRYEFDNRDSPWFIASDVCRAVGNKAPTKGARNLAGNPLAYRRKEAYFSESAVQTYLTPLAVNNDAANRLLVIIRNDVLRRLDKTRGVKMPDDPLGS